MTNDTPNTDEVEMSRITPERRLRMAAGLVRTLAEDLKRLADTAPKSALAELYVQRANAALTITEDWRK